MREIFVFAGWTIMNIEHTYMSSNAEKALILFWRKSEKARF